MKVEHPSDRKVSYLQIHDLKTTQSLRLLLNSSEVPMTISQTLEMTN